MSTFLINKIGKNVQIIEQGEIYREYFEDSANVEIMYNTNSNRVTINIKGSISLTTSNVTEGAYLFMEGVEILDYPTFLTQYALVFLDGGSGPGSTPTLQQVLLEGYSADSSDRAEINLDNNSLGENMKLDGATNEIKLTTDFGPDNTESKLKSDLLEFKDVTNGTETTIGNNRINILSTVYNNSIDLFLPTNQISTTIPKVNGMIIGVDKIQQQDLNLGLQTEISFAPKTNNRFLIIPDKSGTIAVNNYKRKLNISFYAQSGVDGLVIFKTIESANISILSISTIGIGQYYIQFDTITEITNFNDIVAIALKSNNDANINSSIGVEIQLFGPGILSGIVINLYQNQIPFEVQFQMWNLDLTEYF